MTNDELEALIRWVQITYGALNDETLEAAVADMQQIASGVPVERWETAK